MLSAATLMSIENLKAETVLSNLSRGQRGPDPMPGNFQLEANQFMTGPSGPSLINFVTLSASIPSGSQLTLSIYGDNNDQIGANLLGTFTQQQSGHGTDNYTFAAPNVQLSTDSAYWLVVSALPGSTGGWFWTEDASADSPYGWTIGSHAYFGSSSWHYFGFWPYSFGVDATSVPEPHEFAIIGIGLLCAGGFKLRRGRRANSSSSILPQSICGMA